MRYYVDVKKTKKTRRQPHPPPPPPPRPKTLALGAPHKKTKIASYK